MSTDDWNEYKRLVIQGLEDSRQQHADMLKKLNKIETDLATLKVKAGLWGMLAGTVAALTTVLMKGKQ